MPKQINTTKTVKIPKGVKVEVKARCVRVTGPRGTLQRSFKHLSVQVEKKATQIDVSCWFGGRKDRACVRTVASHIANLITGVTNGFLYKMRFVYAHFPVNVTLEKDGTVVEIRNFLGEKVVRVVPMLEGVKVARTSTVKDEITLEGNDIDKVSQSAANIQQSCRICNKDIRKFLDGIYISHRGKIETE